MYPAKRRRIDQASATLCKPFRSPLKTSNDDPNSCLTGKKGDLDGQTPGNGSHKTCPSSKPILKDTLPKIEEPASDRPTSITTDDFIVLQKRYSSLTQELRKLKQDLDVTEQALNIQRSSQGAQIQKLILNWRNIARDAADDVFTATQKRINSMGGMKAWQENTLHSSEYWQDKTRSQDPTTSAQTNDASDNEAEYARGEDAHETDGDHVGAEEAEQDTLSIGMMLRHLNVDPDLLGYDEVAQCWTP